MRPPMSHAELWSQFHILRMCEKFANYWRIFMEEKNPRF